MSELSAAHQPRSACRVLVVDDDEMMCQFIERSLKRRAFEVTCETSPNGALELLTTEDFDVVVSDLNMEGLDGLAFAQKVIELRPDTPVILITGSDLVQVAIDGVKTGAWDFLAKPLDPKVLAISIERACEHRQLKKELQRLQTKLENSQTAPAVSRDWLG